LKLPEPIRPKEIKVKGNNKYDIDAMNEEAYSAYTKNLTKCENCDRTFIYQVNIFF